MNPYRSYQENMNALTKILTQRTRLALSHKNVEFVLENQNASLQALSAYLRRCREELGHIPGRTEVIGGDFIELRFHGWKNALCASGVPAEAAARRQAPALEKTELFRQELERQRMLDKQEKREKKHENQEKMRQEKALRRAAE